MNLRFKTNLTEHTKAVGAWARRHGAHAFVDACDFSLTLRKDKRTLKLMPQFVGKRESGQLMYFDQADEYAIGFVGWLPYKPLAWDISLSKLAFKKTAADLGLRTPAHWLRAGSINGPCLVKRARGAFGYGMRGPFAPQHIHADPALSQLNEGEYYEAFHWGRIARAWYWSGELAVLEVFDMPSVQGDGKSRYRDLLQRLAVEWPDDIDALARLQGVSADDVLPTGRRVVCDYRYVSPFNPTVYANSNVLRAGRTGRGSKLVCAFEDAGRLLWPRIPAPETQSGRQAGFVLDAIVDAEDQPWFLEINSNAQGHPDLYAPMLDALLAPAPAAVCAT